MSCDSTTFTETVNFPEVLFVTVKTLSVKTVGVIKIFAESAAFCEITSTLAVLAGRIQLPLALVEAKTSASIF